MKKAEDIRWVLQLDSFSKAFEQLKVVVKLSNERSLSDLEKQGLIQVFEFTHELAWKNIKDFLRIRVILKSMAPKMLPEKLLVMES